jgi:hypothetical protein
MRLRKVRITVMIKDEDATPEFVRKWIGQNFSEKEEHVVDVEFPDGLAGDPTDEDLYDPDYIDPDLPRE